MGIPKIFGNSRGDFLNFGKNKKKNVVAPKSGKKSCGGATVTYYFFLPYTKFGMDILHDPRNKPAEEFFIFLKIQDGRRRSKICKALYFNGSYKLTGQFYTSLI